MQPKQSDYITVQELYIAKLKQITISKDLYESFETSYSFTEEIMEKVGSKMSKAGISCIEEQQAHLVEKQESAKKVLLEIYEDSKAFAEKHQLPPPADVSTREWGMT